MDETVTFIHAADLHLGAAFIGIRNLSPSWADELVSSIPLAFERIIATALERNVDFVVFAGDTFDDEAPSYANHALFFDGLRRLGTAGIKAYIVAGNHDPFPAWNQNWSRLPENAVLFAADAPSYELYERDGEPLVLIAGRSFPSRAFPGDEDVSRGVSRETMVRELGVDAPFALGIIHTGLDIDPTRAPVAPKSLLGRGVDYWACGHIHHPLLFPEGNPSIAYSGSPQGRTSNETGMHGVFEVTLRAGHAPRTEFIPCAEIVWDRFDVDVSGCVTVSEVREKIQSEQFRRNATLHCPKMVCRITLTGRTRLHKEFTPALLGDVRDSVNESYSSFFIDDIVDATRAELDFDELKAQGLFPAVLIESFESLSVHETEMLFDLEREFADRNLTLSSSVRRSYQTALSDAQTLVFDLLSEEAGR